MYPFRVFDYEDNNNSKLETDNLIFAIEYFIAFQIYTSGHIQHVVNPISPNYTGNIRSQTYNLPYIPSVTNTASSIGFANGVPIMVPGYTKSKIIYRIHKNYLEQYTNKSVKYKL